MRVRVRVLLVGLVVIVGGCTGRQSAASNDAPPVSLPPLPSTVVSLAPITLVDSNTTVGCGGRAWRDLPTDPHEYAALCRPDVEAGRIPASDLSPLAFYVEECGTEPLYTRAYRSLSDAEYTTLVWHVHDCLLDKAKQGLVWWSGRVQFDVATPECSFGRNPSRFDRAGRRALHECWRRMLNFYELQTPSDASARTPIG